MPRKEFVAFNRLDASDVNTFLMDQSVMTFASAAARGSAIATPVEGMYTHLEDTDRLEFWNGSAWRSPFGMTLLANQAYSSANSITIENVFTTEFNAYKMIVESTSASGGGDVAIQFRVGGSTTASNYQDVSLQSFVNATTVTSRSAQTNSVVGRFDTNGGIAEVLINRPALASITYGLATSYDSLSVMKQFGYAQGDSIAFTGIVIAVPTGSGNVRIYGLRNS